MLQQHTVQACPQAPNMAKRVKVVLEPFKLGDFPIQSLTLQKDVKVRFLAAPEGLLTEGNGAVPDAPDAYDHYTPILTDVDRRPYINLTPAKEDWLRTPYGIDPTRASTLFDKNGIPEVLRLAIEADDACERLFLAMDKKIKKGIEQTTFEDSGTFLFSVSHERRREVPSMLPASVGLAHDAIQTCPRWESHVRYGMGFYQGRQFPKRSCQSDRLTYSGLGDR